VEDLTVGSVERGLREFDRGRGRPAAEEPTDHHDPDQDRAAIRAARLEPTEALAAE
jgi:hypothetical protein